MAEAINPEEYQFPSIYNFPPFFTRQINQQVWNSQLGSWADLITSYCRHHRIWRLDATNDYTGLFENKLLKRKVRPDTIRDILDHLVASGQAMWTDPETIKSTSAKDSTAISSSRYLRQPAGILVLWQSLDDWAAILSQWLADTGHPKGSVLTLYELLEDEESRVPALIGMDRQLFGAVATKLVAKGSAVAMRDGNGGLVGLKTC
ncbi:ESCRT-II complex, vps25 subunit [Nadsonia fulvescens var. elongata DSM 6958]|uniref:ESCRT-II complex, vps25 subunit n=1 Tax=Nadsonia fulvescens var. elongata DSM 6958 TaxID=857566 RepID=A0A1E3PIC3_9ASCO|nr:ESCRT-II complex, vps25 subunit [Nadsonia fulvescens var. elongata DSM 6958]